MQDFLKSTDLIDWEHRAIRDLALQLADGAEPISVVARCFGWVRDYIRHSIDHGDTRVTLVASDVLHHGTGLCYAKSHLLAALLRANAIPCGFVYQRLAQDETENKFCLHGLNAVWLADYGWYRIDPRGNRPGIATTFDPPIEHLAFHTRLPGERTIETVFPDPHPVVVSSLRSHHSVSELCQNLPDVDTDEQ